MRTRVKEFAKRVLPARVVHKIQRKLPKPVPVVPGQRPVRDGRNRVPYYFTPLDDPVWVTPDRASYLTDTDAVIGFEVEGRVWAIPWAVLGAHHVANLVIEGHHYVVTFCDACISGGVFDAEVGGRVVRGRMDGMYYGTPYMIDNDGGLWVMVTMQPIYGAALDVGPLRRIPLVHADWGDWRREHPDTLVVHAPPEPLDGHGGDHRRADHCVVPIFHDQRRGRIDNRLGDVDVVLGVVVDGAPRAYPLELVQQHGGVVNDEIGGHPIAVFCPPGTYSATAWSRVVDGDVLELRWDDERELFTDGASMWDLFGKCVEGPRTGAALESVWGGIEKWFGWSNLFEDAPVWGVDADLGGTGQPWTSALLGGVTRDPRAVDLAGGRPRQMVHHEH